MSISAERQAELKAKLERIEIAAYTLSVRADITSVHGSPYLAIALEVDEQTTRQLQRRHRHGLDEWLVIDASAALAWIVGAAPVYMIATRRI